jgi:threonine/homoserine/homoserine lactone efflux protein
LYDLISFLVPAVGISLSGVLSPGPMTAATLAAGTRSRHAGAVMALGHAIVELPLMVLIIVGVGHFFKFEGVKLAIGLVGGAFLVFLGVRMVQDSRRPIDIKPANAARNDLVAGIMMTAGNPLFLLWWATIGLGLAIQASELGLFAFVLFALIHWLCDLGWLEALSFAGFKGTRLLSDRGQRIVLLVCGLALLFFAANFFYDAAKRAHAIHHPPNRLAPGL